uniref:Uncharacterized protein n=1 Tax=Rhizophora mucronata TaxID=61149 RepID=A0A2P2NEC5_RHIMU
MIEFEVSLLLCLVALMVENEGDNF